MSETGKVKIQTYDFHGYEDSSAHKKVPEYVHEFGLAQNHFNKILVNRLRRIETENRELHIDIQELNDYYIQQIENLNDAMAQMAESANRTISELSDQINTLKKEVDRLRLSEKLNTNSIDRLMREVPGAIDVDI